MTYLNIDVSFSFKIIFKECFLWVSIHFSIKLGIIYDTSTTKGRVEIINNSGSDAKAYELAKNLKEAGFAIVDYSNSTSTVSKTSKGILLHSAVIKSEVVTALKAIV